MMHNFNCTDREIWGGSSVIGMVCWLIGLHFISVNWGPVLTSIIAIITASGIAFFSAMAVDIYKEKVRPRLLKKMKGKRKK